MRPLFLAVVMFGVGSLTPVSGAAIVDGVSRGTSPMVLSLSAGGGAATLTWLNTPRTQCVEVLRRAARTGSSSSSGCPLLWCLHG